LQPGHHAFQPLADRPELAEFLQVGMPARQRFAQPAAPHLVLLTVGRHAQRDDRTIRGALAERFLLAAAVAVEEAVLAHHLSQEFLQFRSGQFGLDALRIAARVAENRGAVAANR